MREATIRGWLASLAATTIFACALVAGCSDDESTSTSGGGSGAIGASSTGGGGSGATGASSTGGTGTGTTSSGGQGQGGAPPPLECGGDFAVTFGTPEDIPLEAAEQSQPFPWNKNGAMAASVCGDLGFAYLDPSGDATYGHYTAAGLEAQSTVASSVWQPPVLFYDSSCAPQVVLIDSGGTLVQASPSGGDSWQTTPISLASLASATVSGIAGLTRGRDGYLHLFLTGSASGEPRVLHGTLEGTSWTFGSLPIIQPISSGSCFGWSTPRVYNYAVDSQGRVHAAYYDNCALGYAVSESGAWQQEIAVPMADDRNISGFDGYIAIDADDQPAIANANSTHYVGWSIKSLTLNYLTRNGGAWDTELIADTADGYAGTDGTQYAGAQVQLFFDAWGQPYVTFNDLASWHITYNYTAVGQIRYAVKACGQWVFQTIFHQDGQSVSPNPIHECLFPTMTVGSDRQTLLFACGERSIASDTGSNSQWNSGWGYPVTPRSFVVSQQMQ